MNVPAFVAMLSAATDEQLADILAIFHRGNDLWTRRTQGSASAAAPVVAPVAEEEPVKPAAPKKEKVAGPKKEKVPKEKVEKPKKEKIPVALPEAVQGAPEASEYRIPEADIDQSVCVARLFNETDASKDKRWKPAVYRELQCGGKLMDGSDLCTKCSKRQEKYAEEPKAGPWTGRITEEPFDWCHMLGTSWATDKNPKFIGAAPEETTDAAGPVSDKAALKAAEKAAVAAQKAAAAAEKAAQKEALKASKPKKSTKKAAPTAPAAEVKVAASSAPAEITEVEGELMCIDGEMYMIKKGNVYEYDEIAEKVGDFVGRLTSDKTINTEEEEEAASESDSD
jgi:hypothetical protein